MLNKSGQWRVSKICFGLVAILSPIALGLKLAGNPGAAFAVGGAAFMALVLALLMGLTAAWEHVRLLWRNRRLRQDHLVHWTYSAGSRAGQEVFIGLDAATLDGELIEWDGLTHVLTDIVWLGGKAATVEFRVALHHFRFGYIGDEALQIPVPADRKEEVRSAIERIRKAPATGRMRRVYVLLWSILFACTTVLLLARLFS